MFSILFDKLFFFFIICLVGTVVASDDIKEDNADRGSRSDKGGLWFGPRLGKRSSGPEGENDRASIVNLLKAAEAVKFYYDQMQNYDAPNDEDLATYIKAKKKVIFTPRPGRATNEQKKVIFRPILGRSVEEDRSYEAVDFTPRLGRRWQGSPPDYGRYGLGRQDSDEIEFRDLFSPRLGRNLNYSPRLGRSDMTFSPRLGRDIMTFSPRLGRDMQFSPRLGRDMTFSPRLGRELDIEVYPEQSRVARSATTDKTKQTKTT